MARHGGWEKDSFVGKGAQLASAEDPAGDVFAAEVTFLEEKALETLNGLAPGSLHLLLQIVLRPVQIVADDCHHTGLSVSVESGVGVVGQVTLSGCRR
jgi:hypothetical protein